MVDRILCLANSYKHDHRCMAGISLVTRRWVRLVGSTIPGCLTIREASYSDGKEVRLLDIFEAEIDEPCPSNCHPEDVYLNPKPLRLIERFDQPQHVNKLTAHINKNPTVLESYGDRVYCRKIENSPVGHSIALIKPDDLWWWIRDESGKRKNRAIFRIGSANRIRYDLAVTDPVWLHQLNQLNPGIYPNALFAGGKARKTLLTISLSEPFEGFHYKLIAGVICLPEAGRTSLNRTETRRTLPASPSPDRLP
jgi:hypothetical protein